MPERTNSGWNCTVSEIAEMFRLTRKTVQDMINSGMPVVVRGSQGSGKPTIVNLHDFYEWTKGRAKPPKEQSETEKRLNEIKVEKAELDLAERRGDLFHLADWGPLVEDMAILYRNELANVSKEIQDEFSDVPRIAQIGRAVYRKIGDALQRFQVQLNSVPAKAQKDR